MSAPVVQWQMVTARPEEAGRFYGGLFGWKVSNANALGYREVAAGEAGIPGGFWPAPAHAASFVQLFIQVPDVDDTVARATELGARVLVPSTTLPDGDTMAVLADPLGVPFGLVRRA